FPLTSTFTVFWTESPGSFRSSARAGRVRKHVNPARANANRFMEQPPFFAPPSAAADKPCVEGPGHGLFPGRRARRRGPAAAPPRHHGRTPRRESVAGEKRKRGNRVGDGPGRG